MDAYIPVGTRRTVSPTVTLVFKGYYLPNVRTVFNTPSRGMEDRFTELWAVEDGDGS